MGDHSWPPFAPGSMNTPSAVGWVYMFCCGTNAAERRISLPVSASSTYTNPVFPASTTAFLPPTMAVNGKFKWGYQEVPHDLWDLDGVRPPGMAMGGGKKGVVGAGEAGCGYVLDARTGKRV